MLENSTQKYTHTLIVDAIWYSKLYEFRIVIGAKPLYEEVKASRDMIYHYEVPITYAEKLLLEKLDVEEKHSAYHYETAEFVLDWCNKRVKLLKGEKTNITIDKENIDEN